ncbi:MAG: hypothetical protein L0Z53_06020 [Acidobacteriales bacterium]|nr:hypothetical protein [Terriglobales bacterium]
MASKDLKYQIEDALKNCRDQQSFFDRLLHRTLEWPVGDAKLEDLAYAWSESDLSATGLDRHVVDSTAWQIAPLAHGQPWGIFVIEFKHPDAILGRRGVAGVLRKVLRGLVSSRRKDAKLPSWKREHLLFICTHQWQHFRFAYFQSKPEKEDGGDSPRAARSARLKTFGWGPDTSNRTVCEFNLPKLEWPDDESKHDEWVAVWSAAFDKESLTKDFFRRFDEVLDAVQKDLLLQFKGEENASAKAYTQAQLLLERLIFLYFLQNRGWLNQDRRYLPAELEKHIAKRDAFTYYKDFLDKVFWTLSSAPGSGGDRKPGLPFLNGGLFDDDEFAQPGDQRKANPPLKVRNATFQRVFNELLEAFNFTVTEDTPLSQEVAVDPEMLGKVFESIVLHAEAADPDATAPDKRKATGSYYTPRIVVHFICQEVLYQYLLNHLPPLSDATGWGPRLRALLKLDASDGLEPDEIAELKKTITAEQAAQVLALVKPLRCCDPAVGSGAFPVGLLHELVNLRRVLEGAANGYVDPHRGEGSTWLHNTKVDIVQNCLFGVDIQQQAIEICRLRLWLSMVVDYDLGLDPWSAAKSQFNQAIERISQLPNLEMNFHRGDSLHDHICGVPIVIVPEKASRYADDFRAIAERGEKLHRAKKAEQKRKLRVEILGKRLALSRRIVEEEIRLLARDDSALDKLFHDETESSAAKRKRIAHEKQRLEEALGKIEKDSKKLEKLEGRPYDSQFYVELRKLEGADFNSPFNFAWLIDFPGIFAAGSNGSGGFDIIVGNPPFVTARNPEKRELWRERWPRVCHGKYHMLCPFFELSFGLLKPQGELGFIVSNGFAKREFGKPLVEDFFPNIDIQKIVDCSGLMFPGHGTPTCLIFGASRNPAPGSTIRNIVILPGGGDLHTPPEESPLWHSIEAHHSNSSSAREGSPLSPTDVQNGFNKGHEDFHIAVGDCERKRMWKHPCVWNFPDWPVFETVNPATGARMDDFVEEDTGFDAITAANDIYGQPPDVFRRMQIEQRQMLQMLNGDDIRNYMATTPLYLLWPYSAKARPQLESTTKDFLKPWKDFLSERSQFHKTQLEAGLEWYEYREYHRKGVKPPSIGYPEIATHSHFLTTNHAVAFVQTAPVVRPDDKFGIAECNLLAAFLNSSGALFWLKQVCFNKGAGEDEERDRFVYAGNKVQQLPVPSQVADALSGKRNDLAERLTQLSQACWERGQRIPALGMRKLVEKANEAYHPWNSALSGYIAPDGELGVAFDSTATLRRAYEKAQAIRERLRAEMIARQEEMDWLVYAAYGLLPEDHAAVGMEDGQQQEGRQDAGGTLLRGQRPFGLWVQAEGDYDRAVALIPAGWPAARKKLWEARLAAIRDNEHIRRIEQPVYKRRWDEQWKVGNQWRCGPIAYAAEFVDAFEWWLREKAEWWLEHKKSGGPVELDAWADALWRDSRVAAAWPVAAEQYAFLEAEKAREKAEENGDAPPAAVATPSAAGGTAGARTERSERVQPASASSQAASDRAGFVRAFKRIIEDETVPAGFPFAVPYDDLEKKLKKKVPARLRSIRGKLNVPRERFHRHDDNTYSWAGLQFKS